MGIFQEVSLRLIGSHMCIILFLSDQANGAVVNWDIVHDLLVEYQKKLILKKRKLKNCLTKGISRGLK